MEHEEAIRSKAAERYVAHELSAVDQEAFEEHFFDCQACADDVRLELTFEANARAVAQEQRGKRAPKPDPRQVGSKPRGFFRPSPFVVLSVAANLALAAGLALVLANQAGEDGQAKLARVYFAPGPAHGAADVHMLDGGESFYRVRFLVPGQASSSFFYEILDASGGRESSGFLPALSAADDDLCLRVPVGKLPNGVHTLEVRAGGREGDIVSRSRFQTSH